MDNNANTTLRLGDARQVAPLHNLGDQEHVSETLRKVRQTLSFFAGRGREEDSLQVVDGDGEVHNELIASSELMDGEPITDYFPSRVNEDEANERRMKWAREWDCTDSDGKVASAPSVGSAAQLRKNRERENIMAFGGSLGDVFSPPLRRNLNIDRVERNHDDTTSPGLDPIPNYSRPLTEADVRGARHSDPGNFEGISLEAALRAGRRQQRHHPSQQLEQQNQNPHSQRREEGQERQTNDINGTDAGRRQDDWNGVGLGEILVPTHHPLQQQQQLEQNTRRSHSLTQPPAGNPINLLRQQPSHRTRANIQAERAAETEGVWGQSLDSVFVRRRPAREARDDDLVSTGMEVRSRDRERGRGRGRGRGRDRDRIRGRGERINDVGQIGGRRSRGRSSVIMPYSSIYADSNNFRSDAQIASLSYEDLLELDREAVEASAAKIRKANFQRILNQGLVSVKWSGADSDKKVKNKSTECVICLENFVDGEVVMRINCGHCYHKKCIKEWLKHDTRCPTCRYDICVAN